MDELDNELDVIDAIFDTDDFDDEEVFDDSEVSNELDIDDTFEDAGTSEDDNTESDEDDDYGFLGISDDDTESDEDDSIGSDKTDSINFDEVDDTDEFISESNNFDDTLVDDSELSEDNSDDTSDDTSDDEDDDSEFGEYSEFSLEELQAKIAQAKEDIQNSSDSDDEFTFDDVDSDEKIRQELLNDEYTDKSNQSYDIVEDENGFISSTGDIVVMDPDDDNDAFSLVYADIQNIALASRIRVNTNVEDLTKSIKSTGLLKPINVAPTNATGYYVLLDGYRRLLACARAGKRNIPCVINNKVRIQEIPILEAMHNHHRSYTIKEQVDYINYLEKQKGIMSASMIEYLLQMNSGDYTKLKDILEDNDDDIVEKMMSGVYTIDAAFKKLEQRRKKETAEEKENKKAGKIYDENSGDLATTIAGSGEVGTGAEISSEDLANLSLNVQDLDKVEDEDLDELITEGKNIPGFQPHKQNPKYRERLDPTLRKSVLARDNNTCQICKVISGQEFTEVLDVHHIQEVYLGGSDDIDNLVTACTVCHKLVHLYARGELNIRPLEEMSEQEQRRFKYIVKLGLVIRHGMAAKGMKVEELKNYDKASTIGRTKPGESQEAG